MEVNLLLLYFEKWVGTCKLNNFSCECRSNYFLFFPVSPETWEKISILQHSKEELPTCGSMELFFSKRPINNKAEGHEWCKQILFFIVHINFPMKHVAQRRFV